MKKRKKTILSRKVLANKNKIIYNYMYMYIYIYKGVVQAKF